MIEFDDHVRIARALASGAIGGGGPGRPRETDLRRAVSNAYYALFHALARTCADMLVGSSPASRRRRAWRQTYRALNHGYARRQCDRRRLMSEFPMEIREFGVLFSDTQIMRHRAEYDPHASDEFRRTQVLRLIGEVERIISRFLSAPAADRREFAVYVLLPIRGD